MLTDWESWFLHIESNKYYEATKLVLPSNFIGENVKMRAGKTQCKS